MAIYVSQAFATAVTEWWEAAQAAGGSAPALWRMVLAKGMECLITNEAGAMAAAEAVLNREAVIFGGQVLGMTSTAQAVGWSAGETGAATAAGLAAGLIVCAGLLAAGSYLYIKVQNKRDYDATIRDAAWQYFNQYWPRYVRSALNKVKIHHGYLPPEPMSFQEFLEARGTKLATGRL